MVRLLFPLKTDRARRAAKTSMQCLDAMLDEDGIPLSVRRFLPLKDIVNGTQILWSLDSPGERPGARGRYR
jgi:hypothetical protein